jgi:hypothetical protein
MMEMMRCSHHVILTLVVCVGCGSVKPNQLPDAPPAIDATTRGTVRVTVLDPSGTGAPAVGANVVFIDPDGTLVKKAATDSAGKADADVLPGASVTAIIAVNTQVRLQTVLAVKPGDDLVVGTRSPDSSSAGSFTISYPPFAGATSYWVTTPCVSTTFAAPASGGTPAPATIELANSCKLDTMEIVVVAQNASGPLNSIAKSGVKFTSGGSTAITGSYQGLRNFTASYTNIDSGISNLDMTRWSPDALAGYSNNQSIVPTGATQTFSVTGPISTGGTVVTQVNNKSLSAAQLVRQAISGNAATYGLDVGATLLPWIKQSTFDAATNKVVVPLDLTGTSAAKPDLFRISLGYRRIDNNMTRLYGWTIFGPEAADIVLPVLPADLGGVGPTAGDTVGITTVGMLEADTITSYDAIRNDVNAAFDQYTSERPPAAAVRISVGPGQRVP